MKEICRYFHTWDTGQIEFRIVFEQNDKLHGIYFSEGLDGWIGTFIMSGYCLGSEERCACHGNHENQEGTNDLKLSVEDAMRIWNDPIPWFTLAYL